MISIHIPEGQPLDPEACRESLDMGRKFWGGEIPYVCHSWLLFPGLKELLDEKSNILRFQQMFEYPVGGFSVPGKGRKDRFDWPE